MSKGHCILSHGFESGPDAAKVTALADAAGRLGWTHERPDYTDLDAKRELGRHGDVAARLQRLLELARDAASKGPLVLAGSSLGAWISCHVSAQVGPAGLFLLAPPVRMGDVPPMEPADVPIAVVHGWHDELIPANAVVEWAAARNATLLLVDDAHRLSNHVAETVSLFERFLLALSSA